MPSETLHSSHLAHQPGETVTDSGIILPSGVGRERNLRGTIPYDQIQQDKEALRNRAESPYDKVVLGSEGPLETHSKVLEEVTTEIDAQKKELSDLREANTVLKEELAAMRREIAELKGAKPQEDELSLETTDSPEESDTPDVAATPDNSKAVIVPDKSDTDADKVVATTPEPTPLTIPKPGPRLAPPAASVPPAPVAAKVDTVVPADAEPAAASVPLAPREPGTFHNGKKVSVAEILESHPGAPEKDRVLVIDEEGNQQSVLAQELAYASRTKSAADVDSEPVKVPGKELVLYTGPIEEKEKSRFDKVKGWFKKERKHLQEFGGMAFFSGLAKRASEGVKSATFDAGVHSGMMDWEIEKKRDRNRKIILIGVGALAVWAIAKNVDWNGVDLPDLTPDSGTGGGGGETPPVDTPAVDPETKDILDGSTPAVDPEVQDVLDGSAPTDYELPPTEAAPIPSELFNVPQGGGGEQLFTNLGIDPAKWYANENSLLSQFPNDFYRMDDGHVGIANPGMLPPQVQDFISTLK